MAKTVTNIEAEVARNIDSSSDYSTEIAEAVEDSAHGLEESINLPYMRREFTETLIVTPTVAFTSPFADNAVVKALTLAMLLNSSGQDLHKLRLMKQADIPDGEGEDVDVPSHYYWLGEREGNKIRLWPDPGTTANYGIRFEGWFFSQPWPLGPFNFRGKPSKDYEHWLANSPLKRLWISEAVILLGPVLRDQNLLAAHGAIADREWEKVWRYVDQYENTNASAVTGQTTWG